MLNQLETMFWEILPNGNLNKLEFHFLPSSKGNMKAGSPVPVAWVLDAIRGPGTLPVTHGPRRLLRLPAYPQSWRGREGPKAPSAG